MCLYSDCYLRLPQEHLRVEGYVTISIQFSRRALLQETKTKASKMSNTEDSDGL